MHLANSFANPKRVALALPKDFFITAPEVFAFGTRREQKHSQEKPLHQQKPRLPTVQNIAALYGYTNKDWGMLAGEILDHDGKIHLTYRIGRRGKGRFLAQIGRDVASISAYHLGQSMHTNISYTT